MKSEKKLPQNLKSKVKNIVNSAKYNFYNGLMATGILSVGLGAARTGGIYYEDGITSPANLALMGTTLFIGGLYGKIASIYKTAKEFETERKDLLKEINIFQEEQRKEKVEKEKPSQFALRYWIPFWGQYKAIVNARYTNTPIHDASSNKDTLLKRIPWIVYSLFCAGSSAVAVGNICNQLNNLEQILRN